MKGYIRHFAGKSNHNNKLNDEEDEEDFTERIRKQKDKKIKDQDSIKDTSPSNSDSDSDSDGIVVRRRPRVVELTENKETNDGEKMKDISINNNKEIILENRDAMVDESSNSDEDSESDDDDSSSDEEEEDIMPPPVFINKTAEEREAENLAKLKEEQKKEEDANLVAELHKQESKSKVQELLLREELRAAQKAEESALSEFHDVLPDDTDKPEEDFKAWMDREKARMIRDYKKMLEIKREEEKTEARRAMTDEEVMALDKSLGKHDDKKKQQWSYLQKYYKSGAFTRYTHDEKGKKDDIFKRDIQATAEDKRDFSSLPKILQNRDFGKRSQSKYTHLVDQDTNDFRDHFYKVQNANAQKRVEQRLEKKYGAVNKRHSKKRKLNPK